MNCLGCQHRYNKSKRRPIMSDCGHTTCEECRVKLTKCPKCHAIIDKSKWMVNEAIIQILNDKLQVDRVVNVCLIGESSVGKTCLQKRLCGLGFSSFLPNTLGIDFMRLIVGVGNLNVQLQIWDTAGQESFFSICKSTYQKAQIIILVLDDNLEDKDNRYLKIIDEICSKDVKKIFVINKIDINPDIKRLPNYQYISCKNNEGIDDLLRVIKEMTITSKKMKQQPKSSFKLASNKKKEIETKNQNHSESSKKGGCC